MSESTGISWADHTWSPWLGCAKVSPGCRFCYAETLLSGRMGRANAWGKTGTRTRTKTTWKNVRRWNAAAERDGVRRRVFPSLCDPFECRDGDQMTIVDDMWELIRECPALDFLLLTKRPGNIEGSLPEGWGAGWPNVWLGVSVESGEDSVVCGYSRRPVRERVLTLAEVPAVVRFVSYEPAIGPPERFLRMMRGMEPIATDWIIYGGESGSGRRPEGTSEDPKLWAREIRQWCRMWSVAFWHKQSSDFRPDQGVELDGEIIHELPTPRRGRPFDPVGQGSLFTQENP